MLTGITHRPGALGPEQVMEPKLKGIVRCDSCEWQETVPNVFIYRDASCPMCRRELMGDHDKEVIDALSNGMAAGVVFEPDKGPEGTVLVHIDTGERKKGEWS
jgi:hypothetical protein